MPADSTGTVGPPRWHAGRRMHRLKRVEHMDRRPRDFEQSRRRCRCNALRAGSMLASMSKIHPGVDVVPVDWSADGVSELVPTGTVTLLLADIEGATHLPGSQLDTTAIAKLDRTLTELVREHRGFARSNRAKATASWWRSPAHPTPWRAPWACSGRRWHRSGCASACTPGGVVTRRGQLRRADHRPHRPAARAGPRGPDRVVGNYQRSGC